ncbi:MAG: V-type ATP synthase subunit I [Spirochaetaceae bacterium]|jgi:V/A-type H+-transporting ATPase subunit I|nr:V-type ATP synthase subunit I [Spirochaetaceae bacterium]
MKKVSIFVLDKQKENALNVIRDLGLVHIERKTVNSAALGDLNDRRNRVDTAVNILKGFAPKKGENLPPAAAIAGVDKDLISQIIERSDTRKALLDEVFNNTREIGRFDQWGNFDPKEAAYLNAHDVTFLLYEISLASYQKLGNERVMVLNTDKKENKVRVVAFDKLPGEYPYPMPEKSIAEIEVVSAQKRAEIAGIERELKALYPHLAEIEAAKKRLDVEIEFETARAGMEMVIGGAEEDAAAARYPVSVFTGYAPANEVGLLKRAASEHGWALMADDPAADDEQVPTKLKNNRFFSLLYPLSDFLEIVPGYREVDITGTFLVFFCVFFGMIFSDAAYGIILGTAAIIGMLKTAKKGVPAAFKMMLLLAVCNITWGVLTCTWFGIEPDKLPAILQNISLPAISGAVAAQGPDAKAVVDQNLMLLCFSIALVHLGLAHVRGFFVHLVKGNLKFFAELGQLAMLAGMYRVVLALVVDATRFPFGPIAFENIWFSTLIGGFALVFIFGNYEGNIIKSILASISNFISSILGVTNVFSDIMSYIRLWAVGLAGGSLASTVNSMAGPMLGHFLTFAAIVLLVFGHGFNMVLNVLSVIVHGVRLNTLEFSGHVGLTWSGTAYKPFAKRNK